MQSKHYIYNILSICLRLFYSSTYVHIDFNDTDISRQPGGRSSDITYHSTSRGQVIVYKLTAMHTGAHTYKQIIAQHGVRYVDILYATLYMNVYVCVYIYNQYIHTSIVTKLQVHSTVSVQDCNLIMQQTTRVPCAV